MLVVEDDPVARELLSEYFSHECFNVIVRPDAEGCEKTILEENIHICLIDIKLPGRDGLTLTHDIRAVSNVGIILVTSKDELVDRVVGLESGADDYVTKPFEVRELLSRVKNVLRRLEIQQKPVKGEKCTFNDWTLDVNKQELVAPTKEKIAISIAEFKLLLVLVDNAGVVMTRDELMYHVRNREWYPDDRYIDVLIGQVRRKFKKYPPGNSFITTVHGKGYLFEPEVMRI